MTPRSLLEKTYLYGIAVVMGLIVLHAPLTVFFETHFGHGLIIKAWKELVMGGLLVLAMVIITRRKLWHAFVRDRLVVISGLLAVLYGVSIGYGHGTRPYAAGLLIDLRYVLFAVLVYVAVKVFPAARPFLCKVALIGAAVVIGFGTLQLFLPKDFLSVLGYSRDTITPYTTVDSDESLPRLQSTLRGPNPLGAYAMGTALIAGVAALRMRRFRIPLGILAGLSLVVLVGSYSRSAVLGLIVGGIAGVAVLAGRRLASRRNVVITVAAVLLLTAGFFAIRGTPFYRGVIEHDVAGSGPTADSNEGHSRSVLAGLRAVVTHPLGSGTGSTGSASLLGSDGYIVENQYLYVAHEIGLLGLGLFVGLLVILLARAYARRADPFAAGVFMSGIGLAVVGLLLPVFADDTVSIVWFGLAAIVAGSPESPEAVS